MGMIEIMDNYYETEARDDSKDVECTFEVIDNND